MTAKKTQISSDFYYSNSDKIAFMIVGYDNPSEVNELMKTLKRGKAKILKLIKKADAEVFTTIVSESSRYKHMRVFYIRDIPRKYVHSSAFELGKDWSMHKWLAF